MQIECRKAAAFQAKFVQYDGKRTSEETAKAKPLIVRCCLNSITIPDGVKGIEKYAFEGCSAEIYYKGNIYTEENYGEIYKMFE